MNKKEIPLTLVRSLREVKTILREKANNFEGVKVYSETSTSIRIVDEDEDSDFFFEVSDFNLIQNRPYVVFTFKPSTENSVKEKSGQLIAGQVEGLFSKWLSMLLEYNNITLTPNEKILKAYEDEFFTDFEIVEEDADEMPFDLNQQLYLDKYLEAIEDSLKSQEDESILPILNETKALRANLTNETKSSVIRKFSKILSMIRKKGLNLLKEVYSEAKKEVIKRIIDGTFEGVDNMLM